MAMMLSMMIVAKLIQSVIPDLPNGLGDVFSFMSATVVLFSILTKFKNVILVVAIYIFGIVWINPNMFISGTEYVTDTKDVIGVYFLDYVIPVFIMTIVALFKKNKTIWLVIVISFVLNYISHVSSGIVFWGSYSWKGWSVWTYSLVANLITFVSTMSMSILVSIVIVKNVKHINA